MQISITLADTDLHLHGPAVDELAGGLGVVKDDGGLLAAVEDDAVVISLLGSSECLPAFLCIGYLII